jgi:hypothetical protein
VTGLPDILDVQWLGVDGSVWDLYSGVDGVSLADGLSGLHLPTWTQQVATSARVAGRAYKGTVYGPRTAVLNLNVGDIWGGSPRVGRAWRDLDAAWWRSLSPEVPGRLLVSSDSGGFRFLDCRLDAAPDPAYQKDPGLLGLGTYAATLVSDAAFWKGLDVQKTFTFDVQPVNYYSGVAGTGGSVVYISRASSLASATISNPGDRPTYARWTFTGPGVVTFGIDGHTTTLPPLTAGQVLMIESDPQVSTVTDAAGTNLWPIVGLCDFTVPVPPGAAVPLDLRIEGGVYMTSSIAVALTPLYDRAT